MCSLCKRLRHAAGAVQNASQCMAIWLEWPGLRWTAHRTCRHVQAAKGLTQLRMMILAGRAAALAGCTVGQQMKLLVDALDYMQAIEDGEPALEHAHSAVESAVQC